MDPTPPDRWRGERMKFWGLLIITLLILAFVVIRYWWETGR